ncbi:GntR family transcriptional regulator [Micromonospora sp. NPDC005707]|uniref:GntR family transcriptional regulator n=1 Tax=Micromonospora sp. NPDC005707 TaxID=3157050 RepID=UPI0033D38597
MAGQGVDEQCGDCGYLGRARPAYTCGHGGVPSGDLAPGASLPSELRLAQEYGLSRTSVRQTISLLRRKGS